MHSTPNSIDFHRFHLLLSSIYLITYLLSELLLNKKLSNTQSKRTQHLLWLEKTWIYLTPYVCTERIEVGSSHLYASFGTFCVEIGLLFEAQWDFELSEVFEIDVIFLHKQRFYRFLNIFQRLTVPPTQKVPKEA